MVLRVLALAMFSLGSAKLIIMGPILGLWRDTWWVWLVFVAIVVLLTWLVTPYYIVFLPILPGVFVYFAYNRYDSDGKEKPDVDR